MPTFDLRPLTAGQVELHDARRKRRWTVDLEPFEIGAISVVNAELKDCQYRQYRTLPLALLIGTSLWISRYIGLSTQGTELGVKEPIWR